MSTQKSNTSVFVATDNEQHEGTLILTNSPGIVELMNVIFALKAAKQMQLSFKFPFKSSSTPQSLLGSKWDSES